MINLFRVKEYAEIYASRIALKLFYMVPVNPKKVFFSSYEGKQFSCNPKYIYLELKNRGDDYQYVYEYNSEKRPTGLDPDTKMVRHNSLAYFLAILTSKVIITNSGITAKIPIRKSQVVINTWHGGGAYKKCGKDINENLNGSGKIYIECSEKQTTYFLASCRRFAEAMNTGLGMPMDKMIYSGMPRNDLFFEEKEKKEAHIDKIKTKLGLDKSEKIVLYAPTYRGAAGNAEAVSHDKMDIAGLLLALQNKFSGSWRLLYRGHYFNHEDLRATNIMDASSYPDMQELLLAADVLITDYSSSVWDFSFTKNPGFLFVPDLDVYQKNRDFYTPIAEWPYKTARDMDELYKVINAYNQAEQIERNIAHQLALGSCETGKATKMVCDLIKKSVK